MSKYVIAFIFNIIIMKIFSVIDYKKTQELIAYMKNEEAKALKKIKELYN